MGKRSRPGGRKRQYALLLGAVSAVAVGVALLLYATGALHELELDTVDERFSIRGAEEPRDDIVLVVINDVTFQELNIRFPFPRSLHGKVVDAVAEGDPKAIAYDIEFLEPTVPREDNALIDAVARAGPGKVVLADTQPNESGESGVFGGGGVLEQIGARAGNTQLGEDPDGVLRRLPREVGGMETFPIATAETVSGVGIDKGQMGGDEAWIDFAGPAGVYPTVSYSKVVSGEVDPATFADKIVVVGGSDPSLKDILPTSTTDEEPMSGPEAEANGIATALAGFPLQSLPLGLDLVLIVLMGVVTPLASYRFSPLRALVIGLGVGAAYLAFAQLAFEADTIVPVLYPMLALAISLVGALAVYYVLEAVERQRVRDTFARFVPEQVVGDVLDRTDDDLRLGGRRLEVTVLFSDIRGFTTFSESREPEDVLEILNRYHEEMTEAVMEHGGTLISFIGDGIIAVFGAPIESSDHAERAVASAREMIATRLPRFNEWMRERGVGVRDGRVEQFRIGIGVNSGPVMAGNLGSSKRLDYTVIGDTVNTAARLEGMTKGTPHVLFIADSTHELLTGEGGFEFVAEMDVRGRAGGIRVWAPGEPGAG